ncbi:MAG: hypothetical protein ABIG11_04840 [bacterium]
MYTEAAVLIRRFLETALFLLIFALLALGWLRTVAVLVVLMP